MQIFPRNTLHRNTLSHNATFHTLSHRNTLKNLNSMSLLCVYQVFCLTSLKKVILMLKVPTSYRHKAQYQ